MGSNRKPPSNYLNESENILVVLEILISAVLSNGYDAVIRCMLIRLCNKLSIQYSLLCECEQRLLHSLIQAVLLLSHQENERKPKKTSNVFDSLFYSHS